MPINLSRSMSLSIFDQYQHEIVLQTNASNPFQLFIHHESASSLPSMHLENVTSNTHGHLFSLHWINTTFDYSTMLHFQMKPLNTSLAYLLIYAFDRSPQLNRSLHNIDGWTLFCPSSKSINEQHLSLSMYLFQLFQRFI
jgi:hypothetical protein